MSQPANAVDEQVRDDAACLAAGEFGVLFDRHAVPVHRYLARRAGVGVADDLLAQTFLVAYERRAGFDPARTDARPWLYGIATNLLRRHRRDEVRAYRAWARTGVDPVFVDGPADRVAARVDAAAQAGRLAGALAGLRTADREALLLLAWGELSYPEIAAALGVPVGTVRSRLNRARSKLRAELTTGEDDHG